MSEEKIITATIRVTGPKKVEIGLFDGRLLELDLTRYRFPSDEAALAFLVKLLSSAGYDNMVLAGLSPTMKRR